MQLPIHQGIKQRPAASAVGPLCLESDQTPPLCEVSSYPFPTNEYLKQELRLSGDNSWIPANTAQNGSSSIICRPLIVHSDAGSQPDSVNQNEAGLYSIQFSPVSVVITSGSATSFHFPWLRTFSPYSIITFHSFVPNRIADQFNQVSGEISINLDPFKSFKSLTQVPLFKETCYFYHCALYNQSLNGVISVQTSVRTDNKLIQRYLPEKINGDRPALAAFAAFLKLHCSTSALVLPTSVSWARTPDW